MAKTKRSKHVWQCTVCGYWSQRGANVDRHNRVIHNGLAFKQPAYAALVIEPSWRVTPIADSIAALQQFSPHNSPHEHEGPLLPARTQVFRKGQKNCTKTTIIHLRKT